MEIDELSEILFLEVRNNADREVSFAALSMLNGQILFRDLTIPEKWLTGIEAAFAGVLLLHFYQSETTPTHKGLLAVYSATQKVIWSNFNYTFDHLSSDGPVVYDSRLQPKKLFVADIRTGEKKSDYNPAVQNAPSAVILPLILPLDSITAALPDLNPYGNSVHYLEYNNLRIVSLHAKKAGLLTQSLYILHNGSVVYEDLLNDGIQKLQPEAFMMHKNRLVYARNKSELKVLNL